ncbi:MAG: GNAT family N-acetyltransferase [Sneathiellales bacterium]|nr:GNAT family N-acetyltransferase [Sneathiellales bacterium]
MSDILIRKAEKTDIHAVNNALRKLSEHMSDPHPITDEMLSEAVFGSDGAASILIAEKQGEVMGLTMFSPYVSTNMGGIGIYISDLWVDASLRGQGIGPKLMYEATKQFSSPVKRIKLEVYQDNPKAKETYLRLGFKATERAEYLSLAESDFDNIKGKP